MRSSGSFTYCHHTPSAGAQVRADRGSLISRRPGIAAANSGDRLIFPRPTRMICHFNHWEQANHA
jgi:hypothetical protein